MAKGSRQANFLLPEDLVEELKRSVPVREQSKMVTEALKRELKRLRLQRVLESSFGAWRGEDHPELKKGPESFVRKLRKTGRPRVSR